MSVILEVLSTILKRIDKMISKTNDIDMAVIKCDLSQIFLKVYLGGIRKYSDFLKFFSSDEVIYINNYERAIKGKLNDILIKLSCNFDSYSSLEAVKKDLEYLQSQQSIIADFLCYIIKEMKKRMSVWDRICFFFFNLKLAFNNKGEEKKDDEIK